MRRVDAHAAPPAVLSEVPRPRRRSAPPGRRSRSALEFDGWGYAHLFDAKTGAASSTRSRSQRRWTSASRRASATSRSTSSPTDPTEHLAYSSYYAGGIRVFRFSRGERARADGRVDRARRLELLGRRAVHHGRRHASDRRLGPRLRARDPALHRGRAAVRSAGSATQRARQLACAARTATAPRPRCRPAARVSRGEDSGKYKNGRVAGHA